MKLLFVEDDELLGHATAQMLERGGHQVDWFRTCAQARTSALVTEYDAILLDLGLPDLPGEQFLRELRGARQSTPVVVLTARGQIDDRVRLLDMGADDYLVKPFDIVEVQARLRAVMRRSMAGGDLTDLQTIGPLQVHLSSRTVLWNRSVVTLTSKEFDVLQTLVMRRPRVVSRTQLVDALYGWDEDIESNSIEVYVHFLRRKLAKSVVLTVRGRGYQLGSDEAMTASLREQFKP
jgi:two-component system OmpR family response regulator/two-component system response regulator QseB